MFGGKAGRSVPESYRIRLNAWNEIKEHFNLEDDNDGMSEAVDRLSSLTLANF